MLSVGVPSVLRDVTRKAVTGVKGLQSCPDAHGSSPVQGRASSQSELLQRGARPPSGVLALGILGPHDFPGYTYL